MQSLSKLVSAVATVGLLAPLPLSAQMKTYVCGAPTAGTPPTVVCDEEDYAPGENAIDLPQTSDPYQWTTDGLSVTVAEGVKLDGIDVGTKTIGGVPNSPFSRFRSGIDIRADNVASGDKGITVQSKGDIDANTPIWVRSDHHNNIKIEVMAGLLQSNTAAIGIEGRNQAGSDTTNRGNIDVTLSGTAIVRGHPKTYRIQDSSLTTYITQGIDIHRHVTKGGDVNVVLKDTAKIGGVGGVTDYGIYIRDEYAHEAGSHSAIKVTTGEDTFIGEEAAGDDKTAGYINEEGIYVKIKNNQKRPGAGSERTVTVVHEGQLYAKGNGIKIEHESDVTPSAAAGATADITIGSKGVVQVSGDEYGIYLNTPDRLADDDRRKQSVTIKGGKVVGKLDGGGAIHLKGGGLVTIGRKAVLVPTGDDIANYRTIKVTDADTVGAGKSNLLIRLNQNLNDIKNIQNDKDKTAFQHSMDGKSYTELTMGVKLTVTNVSQVPCGFYNDCIRKSTDEATPKLVDHASASGVFSLTFERDANFQSKKELTIPDTEERELSKRGRVYETLPSVLWDMAGDMDTYRPLMMGGDTASVSASNLRQVAQNEMMGAPDDGMLSDRSAWGHVEAGSGKRQLRKPTTGNQSYDISYGGFAAGIDLPGADGMMFRVGLHHRQGKADATNGGRMKISGTGVGVGMTRQHARGMTIDGWLGAIKFNDIKVTSSEMINGEKINVNAKTKATGYTIAMGIANSMDFRGLMLTQRGGVTWSSVSMDDYAVPYTMTVSGTAEQMQDKVATKNSSGITSQYSVLLEQLTGQQTANCCRLFGSLDIEHDFSTEREVTVTNDDLSTTSKSEVNPTKIRLGIGGSTSWNAGQSVISAAIYHTASGSGNKVTSGQIALSIRF